MSLRQHIEIIIDVLNFAMPKIIIIILLSICFIPKLTAESNTQECICVNKNK